MKAAFPVSVILAVSLAAASPRTYACGTCGCSLNSDWVSQGYIVGSGFHMDLRFDYFDQDQLRTGTGKVDRAGIALPSEEEVQLQTINRNYTLDLSYHLGPDWAMEALIPSAVRTHSTVGEGDLSPSYSRSAGLGDIRILGRYQGFLSDHSLGLQFGLKVPTGRTDDRFALGPLAGETVDRGLQLGSGTTDALLGIYKFGALSSRWGYFLQAMAQVPCGSHRDFKPGASITASGGFRYTGMDHFTPQIQVNFRAEEPETGSEADAANSGASILYLSPGFTADLGARVQVYAFLQVPVVQRVSGYQLEPRYLATVGMHFRF